MEQTIEIKPEKQVKIKESQDIEEIADVLYKLLFVSDLQLKPMIIEKLTKYFQKKFSDKTYKIKIFIAFDNSGYTGFVLSQIHPTYTSYGRKCGTFGWLIAENFESCKNLMMECEFFTKINRLRKLRGPINFPKGLGGMGIQTSGFEHKMLYGVAFNHPRSQIINYLERLGYKKESEYVCMKVTHKTWKSGRTIDKNIRLGYISLKEMYERKEEFHDLIRNSFQGSIPMPDSSGKYRLDEILETFNQVPDSHYDLSKDFAPEKYSDIPEFQEAWEDCDLEKVLTWVHLAFDRNTNKIVGAIFCLPDLYESWLHNPITRANVDTVMVDKNYAGKCIFSALNNIGQLTGYINGIEYFEGTSIWNNNPDAIRSILPHGIPIRKHFIMQKRVKRSEGK